MISKQDNRPLVVITGVSGFLGQWVLKTYLDDGQFRIRATVRDKNNMKKLQPIIKTCGEELIKQVEFVSADLSNAQSIIDACEGATYLVHTASPITLVSVNDENQMIKPAVDGIIAAMTGAHKHKLKRVLITSTVGSIQLPMKSKTVYSEDDYSSLDNPVVTPYYKSKILAEKAAFDFVKALPKDEQFELVALNPSLIMGPTNVTYSFTSGQVIETFFNGHLKKNIKHNFNIVDVRDVAQAHLKGITTKEAAGKRIIIQAQTMWYEKIGEVLLKEFGSDYKLPQGMFKKEEIKQAADAGDHLSKEILNQWGVYRTFDNTRSKNILGMKYRNMETSLVEMAHSMIDTGLIAEKRTKKQTAKL